MNVTKLTSTRNDTQSDTWPKYGDTWHYPSSEGEHGKSRSLYFGMFFIKAMRHKPI